MHRLVADPWPQRGRGGSGCQHGPLLYRELVARVGRVHPVQDRRSTAQQEGRVLMDSALPTSFGAPARDRILEQPVDAVSLKQAIDNVIERSLTGTPGAYVCLTNVHSTVDSQKQPALRAAAEGAYLSVPDGMPLVWILHRRGMGHVQKVTGIDYMPKVAKAG